MEPWIRRRCHPDPGPLRLRRDESDQAADQRVPVQRARQACPRVAWVRRGRTAEPRLLPGGGVSRHRDLLRLSQRHTASGGLMSERKLRVLIAKPGLDGHDRGAKVIARALRDAGMEVIYTGLRQSPEQIVSAAAQEDVDAVGLSILSGAHLPICRRVIELLKEKGMEGVQVFLGGIIPAQDIPELKRMGVAEVFLPGASTEDVIRLIQGAIPAR